MNGTIDKKKLLIFLDDLKIKSNSPEVQVWYDQALQDVIDAVHRGHLEIKEQP